MRNCSPRPPRRGPPRDPLLAALLEARLEQGLSRSGLARRMGYTEGDLARWECERSRPLLSAVRDWAAALGLRLVLEPQKDL